MSNYCKECFERQEKIDRLEQENEKLKQENEELNKMTGIFSARLAEKYKQALEEIREECKVITTIPDGYCGIKNVYQTDSLDELAEKIKKIIERC